MIYSPPVHLPTQPSWKHGPEPLTSPHLAQEVTEEDDRRNDGCEAEWLAEAVCWVVVVKEGMKDFTLFLFL